MCKVRHLFIKLVKIFKTQNQETCSLKKSLVFLDISEVKFILVTSLHMQHVHFHPDSFQLTF